MRAQMGALALKDREDKWNDDLAIEEGKAAWDVSPVVAQRKAAGDDAPRPRRASFDEWAAASASRAASVAPSSTAWAASECGRPYILVP